MEKLKQQLLRTLSGTLPLEALAEWLYADTLINEQIPDNEQVLELLLIDLTGKDAFHELEKYCFRYYTESECLLGIITHSCTSLLNDDSDGNVLRVLRTVDHFHEYEAPYKLLSQLHFFRYDWDLAEDGIVEKEAVRFELLKFVRSVEATLSDPTTDGEQFLLNGIKWPQPGYTYRPYEAVDTTLNNKSEQQATRKWFKFWKK